MAILRKDDFSYIPVGLYGSIMGLSSLSVAWRSSEQYYFLPNTISNLVAIFALACFITLSISYICKIVFFYDCVKEEFLNPLKRSTFSTFFVALLVLCVAIYPFSHYFSFVFYISFVFWVIGFIGQFIFAILMLSFWLKKTQDIKDITPFYIIPVVGLLNIPLAFKQFDTFLDSNIWGYYVSFFAFSVGIFYGIIIIAILVARIIFFMPLEGKLRPTIIILIAPFFVAFSSYLTIFNSFDMALLMLYCVGFFTFLALLPQAYIILKSEFSFTWWSTSFPLGALCVATSRMSANYDILALHILNFTLLILTSVLLIIYSLNTLKSLVKRDYESLC